MRWRNSWFKVASLLGGKCPNSPAIKEHLIKLVAHYACGAVHCLAWEIKLVSSPGAAPALRSRTPQISGLASQWPPHMLFQGAKRHNTLYRDRLLGPEDGQDAHKQVSTSSNSCKLFTQAHQCIWPLKSKGPLCGRCIIGSTVVKIIHWITACAWWHTLLPPFVVIVTSSSLCAINLCFQENSLCACM